MFEVTVMGKGGGGGAPPVVRAPANELLKVPAQVQVAPVEGSVLIFV
jgi:hypothetical protein